jgi:hypothetical protein
VCMHTNPIEERKSNAFREEVGLIGVFHIEEVGLIGVKVCTYQSDGGEKVQGLQQLPADVPHHPKGHTFVPMYVCMCVCMYVCMYVCVYACMC